MPEAAAIRRVILELNPPKYDQKTLTTAAEENTEIAALCPFWTPLLKDRDLRSTEGGDEYIHGLIETFARIYRALKKQGLHHVLASLDTNALFAVDEAMGSQELNIHEEYPVLDMMQVGKMGAFGAGIYAAYGLLEMAIATGGDSRAVQRPAPTPTPRKDATAMEPDFASAMESLLDEVGQPAPEPAPQQAPPSPAFAKVAKGDAHGVRPDWNKAAAAMPRPLQTTVPGMPVVTLHIFDIKDGYKILGDLTPSLGAAARAHELIRHLFGVDANLEVGMNGKIVFSFAVLEKI